MRKVIGLLPWVFLGIFAWLYGQDIATQLTSTDRWFKVDSVVVLDAQEGTSPKVAVDRDILSPFVAEWVVTVRRLQDEGLEIACVGYGKSYYIPEAVLPKDMDLDFWLGKQCKLTAGRYQLDTKWLFDIPGYGGRRTLTVKSNIFHVKT